MALAVDAENQANSNEQTPLLNNHDSDERPESPDQKPSQRRPVSWYLWKLLWVIGTALILTVFVKGWIDAGGDVEVGAATQCI